MTPYYEHGGITIYHGDCLEILDGGVGPIDSVVTDPPYSSGGFNEAGKAGGSVGTVAEKRLIQGDTMSSAGYFALMRRVLRGADASGCYVFTDWRMWPFTTEAVELSGYRLRGMLVWNKGHGGMGARWKAQHELICWGTRVVSEMGEGLGNVLTVSRSGNRLHPTEKPVELLAALVGNSEGDSILDPFMGSGSTGRAAGIEQFKFIGIEINPEYFEIACLRIDSATAQQGLEFT